MPIKYNEISTNSNGGTELVTRSLEKKLIESGHSDLLNFFDIFPSRVRDFNAKNPSILVLHDLPGDPEAEHLINDQGSRFDAMVFVSDWQYMQFLSHYKLTGENCVIIPNAIDEIDLLTQSKWDTPNLGSKENPIRLIYHTTPHRGLEILVPVFEILYKEFLARDIHIVLDVYSSFKIYGWEQRDLPYAGLFKRCEDHPAINYHGSVSNSEVREALQNSHIFAYPSIWQETFCIAAVEAISAHCLVLHSNLAALPEITGSLSYSYPFQSTLNGNANVFYGVLASAINDIITNNSSIKLTTMLAKHRVDSLYSWKAVLPQWIAMLSTLKQKVEAEQ